MFEKANSKINFEVVNENHFIHLNSSSLDINVCLYACIFLPFCFNV